MSLETVANTVPVVDELPAVAAEEHPFTFLRDKSGELFKMYFGSSADVLLMNETARAEHPLA